MRIMRFVSMFVALAFGLVSCEKGGDDGKKPEPIPPTPSDVVEYEMTSAERVNGEDVDLELADNEFMLFFENRAEGVRVTLHLVGGEGDTELKAGEYSTANGGLVAANSGVAIAGDEVYVKEGSAVVTLNDKSYTFDVSFVGSDDKEYEVQYSGEVKDMAPTQQPSGAFVPVKVVAETDASWDLGNFMLQLYIDDTRYHELDMYDTQNPNRKYLSAGRYTTEDGSIGSWSIFNTGPDQNCGVLEAEMELVINKDGSVKLSGYIKSEEEHEITVEWEGFVKGFDFTEEPAPVDGFEASVLDVEYYGQEYSVNYNYYITLSDNGFNESGNMQKNSTYYFFDLYTDVAGDANGGVLPNGSYVLKSGMGVNAIDPENSYAVVISETTPTYIFYQEAVLVISDNHIEAQITFVDGSEQRVIYNGDTTYGGDNGDVGEDNAPIYFTSLAYKEYDSMCWFHTFTLADDNGNSMDLLINDNQANETMIYEGEYTWISNDGRSDLETFSTDNIVINGKSYEAQSGFMFIEREEDGKLSIAFELTFTNGSVQACNFYGYLGE